MRTRSTPFAVFLALLVVLWQPLCLCQAEGGESEHSHGQAHTTEVAGHHHGDEVPASHDHAQGDHQDDGKGDPCDGHGGSCDCSKSFATPSKTAEAGGASQHGPTQFAAAWLPVLLIDVPLNSQRGLRAVAREGLPPPPLLKLYRVLLI